MALQTKYTHLFELLDRMTRRYHSNRPDCGEILDQSDSWAFNDNEFEEIDRIRYRENLNSDLKENSIFNFYKF
jgi:transcription initiation factor IIE alpha subunit